MTQAALREIDGGVHAPCPILIQPGLLTDPTLAGPSPIERVELAIGRAVRTMLVVFDRGIPAEPRQSILGRLGSPPAIELTPSESIKRLSTTETILDACLAAGLNRDEPIIAIGGGVVGDIAGFAAATFQRGVPVIQCPTTLLAMVDASVGGKTGVNLAGSDGVLRKNMAGAFHQPSSVLIDPAFVTSLTSRVYACGLAECVKHGLLSADAGDPELFAWIESNADAINKRSMPVVSELVERNVRVKTSIVRADERELASTAGRALLNLGHTYAHAVEPIHLLSPTENKADAPLQHGEAVALGIVAACHAAELPETHRVESLLERFGLPIRVAGLPEAAELIELMASDKKSRSGKLRLVLPESLGVCRVVDGCDRAVIERGWSAIAAT